VTLQTSHMRASSKEVRPVDLTSLYIVSFYLSLA